MNNKLTSF